jgi:hypothetical protein
MYLIQILLPLRDSRNELFEQRLFDDVRTDLARHFGRVHAYIRPHLSEAWRGSQELIADDVVIFELMTDRLEREFWRLYRRELQDVFQQESLIMRALRIDLL